MLGLCFLCLDTRWGMALEILSRVEWIPTPGAVGHMLYSLVLPVILLAGTCAASLLLTLATRALQAVQFPLPEHFFSGFMIDALGMFHWVCIKLRILSLVEVNKAILAWSF